MMKYLIGCLSICFLLACFGEKAEKPTLSDEKLARIMADLNVAEAATLGLSGYPKDSLMKVYFAQVFEMQGTTPEIYEKDLRLISTDLPHLQKIVLESVRLLEGNGGVKTAQ
jgi:hypothetical protein